MPHSPEGASVTQVPAPNDLHRIEQSRQAGLSWLAGHTDAFLATGQPRSSSSRKKPLLELLLLVACVLRSDRRKQAAAGVSRLTSRLHELAQTPAVLEKPICDGNDLLLRAGLCAVLAGVGQREPLLDSMVEQAIDADVLGHSERLPYHIMEERTVLDWSGFQHRLPAMAALMKRSFLVRPIDAVYLTERSTYELTHNLMFGFSLGETSPDEFSWLDRDELLHVLTDSLVRFERERHWDLVGELLLCWDCLGLVHNRTYADGWRRLVAHQAADGSVPGIGPPGTAMTRPPQPVGPATDDRFRERYHTTLVLVLAATAHARRRDRQEPTTTSFQTSPAAPLKSSATQRDAAWMVRLLDHENTDRQPIVATSVLVGLTLLSALDTTTERVLHKEIGRIRDRLSDLRSYGDVPAALTLASSGILRSLGLDAPGLSDYVEDIRRVVAATPPRPEIRSTWCEHQVLLGQLKLANPPVLPELDVLWKRLDSAVDDPGSADLAEIAQLAGACTGFGTARPGQLSSRDWTGVDHLESLAVEALRRSDLRIGCALLRGAHSLRPLRSGRIRAMTAFIEAHHRSTGGYSAYEEDLASGDGAAQASPDDIEVDIRLPVSLSVLWALVEIGTQHRLYVDHFVDPTRTAGTGAQRA